MQMYEVTYEPKNGTGGTTLSEKLVLACDKVTDIVRAIHPKHKVRGLVPVSPPLKDLGQYTYWTLSFRYSGKTASLMNDDETVGIASRYLAHAERSVAYVLTKLQIEAKHSYSWPDGSLYYTIRTLAADVSGLVHDINRELEALHTTPFSIRKPRLDASGKRCYVRSEFGKVHVVVDSYNQITDPFTCDPHKAGSLNYVDYFETLPYWARDLSKDFEDFTNPLHQAFRSGFEEAFGHHRLFYYKVLPSKFTFSGQGESANDDLCAAYTSAYLLAKLLLTLWLPDPAKQPAWSLLYDEGEKPTFKWSVSA